MRNILISINPEFVEKIFDGSKKYEYRKIKCKQDIDKMIIYSTAPIMKVVGEAKVEKILEDSPDIIWEQTKEYSGIDFEFYQKYFKDRNIETALMPTKTVTAAMNLKRGHILLLRARTRTRTGTAPNST